MRDGSTYSIATMYAVSFGEHGIPGLCVKQDKTSSNRMSLLRAKILVGVH